MPQRRSFGSGCSWRDHQTTTGNNKTPVSTTDSNHKPEDTSSSSGGWTTVQSSGSHPRVIDHVPYRSRPSHEWKGAGSNNKGSNWRGKTDGDHHEVSGEGGRWLKLVIVVTGVYYRRMMKSLSGCRSVRQTNTS